MARELLTQTEMPISTIALSVGFSKEFEFVNILQSQIIKC